MVKIYNFWISFFNKLVEVVRETEPNKVIWFGAHPMCVFIYSILSDMGISFEVVDNDLFKQGLPLLPFLDYATDDDTRMIRIKSIKEITVCEKTIVLMANTHYEEICEQLSAYGVPKWQVFNFYDIGNTSLEFNKEKNLLHSKDKVLNAVDLKKCELDILKKFKRVCEEYKLRYSLYGGTLIGALRHKGFIPWDDDIDVMMPVDDYKKLLSLAYDDGKYRIIDWHNENDHYQQFARMVDTDTVMYEYFFEIGECRTGVFVDIFPVAGYPESDDAIRKRKRELIFLKQRWFYYYIVRDIKGLDYKDPREEIEKEIYKYGFDESDIIGSVALGGKKPWSAEKGAYKDYLDVEFENNSFKIMSGFDEHLKLRYGNDYMIAPIVLERELHSYPAFIMETNNG